MKPFFSFKTESAAGDSPRGRVEFSAGSLSNRAELFLDPGWAGTLKATDAIEIEATAFDQVGSSYSFPVFKGVVNQILPKGDSTYIECVTVGAYLLVQKAPVKAWANTTVKAVFSSLFSLSKASKAPLHLPSGFGGGFLHVWETNGGVLADEVYELLSAHAPGVSILSSFTGDIFVGDRTALGKLLQFWPFPSDVATGPTSKDIVDMQASQFSLRPACPHQLVYNPDDTSFMGTIDSVCHEIRPGRSRTTVIVDHAPSADLSSFLAANK